MGELLKTLIDEQRKTNQILMYGNQGKDPNELLTMKQIHEEYGIGINMVNKMFKDPELEVQTYTVPFKVTRQALENYMNVRHDYLSERS